MAPAAPGSPLPPAPGAPMARRAEMAEDGGNAEAARAFEALLLGEVARAMFAAVPDDGVFGGGHAETIYRDLMAEHMGAAMTARGGLGLSEAVLGELTRMQAR